MAVPPSLPRFCLGAALKGRIKRSSELAATQSGRWDGKRQLGGGTPAGSMGGGGAQRNGLKVELIKEREAVTEGGGGFLF